MTDSSTEAHLSSPSETDAALLALVEEFTERVRAGEQPDVEEYAQRIPERAEEVRDLLETVTTLERAQPSEPADAVPPLKRIGGYRIEREIGRGGMGVVLLATEEALDRRVALKLLPLQATLDKRYLERFQREARAAARLSHPNIVPVFGVGHEQGVHFFVMQYIEGCSLDEVVAALRSEDGSDSPNNIAHSLWTRELSSDGTGWSENIDLGKASTPSATVRGAGAAASLEETAEPDRYYRNVARIGIQVAEALAYAHSHGILHRDVKPGNVILDANGRVWIADFGLCKTTEADQITMTTDMVGTLRYMAPEQIRGGEDVRSDVYGLGATLYELLARRPPFDARDRGELMNQVLNATPRRLRRIDPALPRDLETIVQTSMSKLPAERYGAADALAEDLRAFLDRRPIAARPPSAAYLLRLTARRHRGLVATAAAALAVVVALTVVYLAGLQRSRMEQRHQLYLADVAAAQAALDVDPEATAARLENTPEEFRNWEWAYLRALVDQSLGTLAESHGAVRGIEYSPDGGLEMMALGDRVRVRERGGDGREWLLDGARDYVVDASLGPHGRWVVASDVFHNVLVWDLEDSGSLLVRRRMPVRVEAVHVDRTGDRIFVGLRDARLLVYDPTLTILLDEFHGHGSWVTDIVQTRDGDLLATGSIDGHVRLWSRDGELRRDLVHGQMVFSVALDAAGTRIAAGAEDGVVRVWNAATGEELHAFLGHAHRAQAVAFHPNGRWLATGATDRTIRIWDLESGELLRVLHGHRQWVESLAFRPDDGRLVSGAKDGTVKEWDVETTGGLIQLAGHQADYWTVGFDDKSQYVATTNRDATVRIWDALDGRHLRTFFSPDGAYSAAFSPDSRRLASGGFSGRIQVWDLERGTRLAAFETLGEGRDRGAVVRGLDFDKSGTRLYAGLEYRGIETWEAGPDGWSLAAFESIPDLSISSLSFDGTRLATGTYGGMVRVSRFTAPGSERETVFKDREHEGRVVCLAFRGDDQILASGGVDGLVVLRDAHGGDLLRTLAAEARTSRQGSYVWSLGFNEDGSRLVTASSSVGTSLWDPERGVRTLRLQGPGTSYQRATFSPDGTRIVEGFASGRLRILDTTPTAERRTPRRDASKAEVERILADLGQDALDLEGLPGALDQLDLDDELFQDVLARAHALGGTRQAVLDRARHLLRTGESSYDDLVLAWYLVGGLSKWDLTSSENLALSGEALYRLENWEAAHDKLQSGLRASEVAGDSPFEILLFLAMTSARRGEPDEAQEWLFDALASLQGESPDDPDAILLLQEAETTLRSLEGTTTEE